MIGLDGKPPTGPRSSYTHAQKMRASMTHIFGRILGIGSQPWKQTASSDGRVLVEGNPSISEKVSTYMVSLRRRKVTLVSFGRYISVPYALFHVRSRLVRLRQALVQ
jgi:hypothetical protein